jgi:hypothetical protein
MIRLFTLVLMSAGLLFSAPTFADPEVGASDALAGEQAEEAAPVTEGDAPAPAEGDAAEGTAPAETDDAAEGDAVPDTLDEAAESVSLLIKAVQDKNWALAVGFLMMLLVFVANKFGLKDKVGGKAIPWVVLGLSVASVSGAALASGLAVAESIVQGVLAGVAAIGGWELVFKHILTKKPAAE